MICFDFKLQKSILNCKYVKKTKTITSYFPFRCIHTITLFCAKCHEYTHNNNCYHRQISVCIYYVQFIHKQYVMIYFIYTYFDSLSVYQQKIPQILFIFLSKWYKVHSHAIIFSINTMVQYVNPQTNNIIQNICNKLYDARKIILFS